MREHAIEQIWPTAERLLVCVGPSPCSTRLVRAAKRMADQLGAEWIAAYVETPAQLRLPAEARDGVIQTLRLAEQLGAQTITLSGQTMSEAILAYARDRNVTTDRGGQARAARAGSASSSARSWTRSSRAAATSTSTSSAASARRARARAGAPAAPLPTDWPAYGWAAAVVAVWRPASRWLMLPFSELSNVVMVYLLGIVSSPCAPAGARRCWPPSSASPPSTSSSSRPTSPSRSRDARYLFTFLVMLVVGLVISGLDGAHPRARPKPPSIASSGRRRSTP